MRKLKWKIGVNPCTLGHWRDLEAELVWYLRLLGEESDRWVILAWTKSNRFVQFASRENGEILGEAIGNHYLAEDDRLTPETRRKLRELGWKRPDASEPSNTSETLKRNFWRVWPAPVAIDEIAGLAISTLRDIFTISSPSQLEIKQGTFGPRPEPSNKQKSARRFAGLKRNRTTYEFFVRYPCGTSVINGYRRAARHFKLHTLEDPLSKGQDECRLLIHKNPRKLREAAKVLSDANSRANSLDNDAAMAVLGEADMWLCENDVHWFHHDWKYWDIGQDLGALENLSWRRLVVETDNRYRVTIQKVRPATIAAMVAERGEELLRSALLRAKTGLADD